MAQKRNTIPVRYNKSNISFICDKIREGYTLPDIRKQYPRKCPSTTALYRWRDKHADFDKMYQEARQDCYLQLMDKCREIQSAPLPTPEEIMKQFNCEKDMVKAYLTATMKQRSELTKTIDSAARASAPIKTTKIEVETSGQSQISIIDYTNYVLPGVSKGVVIDGESTQQ